MVQKLRYNELGVGVSCDHCGPSSVSSCQTSCSTSISVSPNISTDGDTSTQGSCIQGAVMVPTQAVTNQSFQNNMHKLLSTSFGKMILLKHKILNAQILRQISLYLSILE